MKLFRPLFRYIRYHFAYAIRPAKKKDYNYIGEVKAWIVKENTSPYKSNPDYFSEKGTFEDWLRNKKEKGRENTKYAKDLIKKHEKYPWATLSQLRYKPRPGEKPLGEAKKLVVDKQDLEWELRAQCDNTLLARSKGNLKRMEKWLDAVTLEEMEGLSRQEIDRLDPNDELNTIKKLMYFNERGGEEYVSVDGIKRKGRLYGDKGLKEWVDKLSPDKKKKLEKKR